MPRRTLAGDATVEGIGLHTGARVTARCVAAEPGRGIVFRRVDLPGAPEVPARLSHVRSTERRTSLGEAPGTVETVEHLLAAAAALQLDDLVVELDGPEPPIGDGSFQPYLTALKKAGIADQPGDPVVYRVTAPFQLTEGDSTYVVAPSPRLRLTTTIEWAAPAHRSPVRQLRHHPRRVRAGPGARRVPSASCGRPKRFEPGVWRRVPTWSPP